MTVTFVFGASTLTLEELAPGATIQSVLPQVKPALRLPENVIARIDGEAQPMGLTLRDGDEVVFEKQAASKA